MGLYLFSRSSYDTGLPAAVVPDPRSATIRFTRRVGRWLIACVSYPDCPSFEGNKILVYRDVTEADLRAWAIIDPHFSERAPERSPLARFPPTAEGLELARDFLAVMDTRDSMWRSRSLPS